MPLFFIDNLIKKRKERKGGKMSSKKNAVKVSLGVMFVMFGVVILVLLTVIKFFLFEDGKELGKGKVEEKEISSLISKPDTNITEVIFSEIVLEKTNSEDQIKVSTVLTQADINQALVFARRKQKEAKQKTFEDSDQDFNPGKEGVINTGR